LAADPENSAELYAVSVSDIQMGLNGGKVDGEGVVDWRDSALSICAKTCPGKSSNPNVKAHWGLAETEEIERGDSEAAAKDHIRPNIGGNPPSPSDADLKLLRHLVEEKRARKGDWNQESLIV